MVIRTLENRALARAACTFREIALTFAVAVLVSHSFSFCNLDMAGNWPKITQDRAKMAPRWPKMAPRWPLDGLKMGPIWPQNGPKKPQNCAHARAPCTFCQIDLTSSFPLNVSSAPYLRNPEMAQDGPKLAQDGSKMAPRWFHDGSKMAPRWFQDRSR